MKSFDQFLSEATADEEDYEEKEAESKAKSAGKSATRKIISRSFKNAMTALRNGDIQRHRYWMQRAYKRLTGNQENV